MNILNTFKIIFLIVVLVIVAESFYIIHEGESGLVMRLGRIVTNSTGQVKVETPGLHWKIPFIDTVTRLDTRLQASVAKSSPIFVGQENYFVIVDYFIKWRIDDLAEFFKSQGGNTSRAVNTMEKTIDGVLRAELGKRSLSDVVAQDRGNILALLIQQVNTNVKNFGIKVIDVRLKTIDLPPAVQQSVFNSMKADRQVKANEYRASGRAKELEIRSQADATKVEIIAKAERDAMEIKAKGTAEAAAIYAGAYNQEPEFFAFFRSLQAYKAVFDNNKDVLVLKPDSEFFKFFNHVGSGEISAKN